MSPGNRRPRPRPHGQRRQQHESAWRENSGSTNTEPRTAPHLQTDRQIRKQTTHKQMRKNDSLPSVYTPRSVSNQSLFVSAQFSFHFRLHPGFLSFPTDGCCNKHLHPGSRPAQEPISDRNTKTAPTTGHHWPPPTARPEDSLHMGGRQPGTGQTSGGTEGT